jgi:hypothetical protein
LRLWSLDSFSLFYFIYFNIKAFCTCLYKCVIFVRFSLRKRVSWNYALLNLYTRNNYVLVFNSWGYCHLITFRSFIRSISFYRPLCTCLYTCVIFVGFCLRKRVLGYYAFLHIYTRKYYVFIIYHLRLWSLDIVSPFYFIYFIIKTSLYVFI